MLFFVRPLIVKSNWLKDTCKLWMISIHFKLLNYKFALVSKNNPDYGRVESYIKRFPRFNNLNTGVPHNSRGLRFSKNSNPRIPKLAILAKKTKDNEGKKHFQSVNN